MASEVRIKDNGAIALKARAEALSRGATSEVGVIGDAAESEREGGLTNAALAAIHEFGLGVPRRSWLRDWVAENESEIAKQLRDATKRVLKQGLSPEQTMAIFGAWAQGSIQARIAAGIDPENAPSTIAKKGSTTPLIDRGQLRSSITHRTSNG